MLKLDLKVAHQGIIIILVPLICELVALGMILYLLDQSDRVFREEAVSKEIVEEASGLVKILYQGVQLIGDYFYTRDTESVKGFKKNADSIQTTYLRLRKLCAGNPDQLERVAALKRDMNQLMIFLFDLGSGPGRPVIEVRNEFTPVFGQLLSNVENIIAAERKSLDKKILEGRVYRERLQLVIVLTIIISIIISINLSQYFSRRIIRRLRIVSNNLSRFLTKEDLSPPVSGSDEIADLDKAFHDMTDMLRNLEQRKQEFVAMISHDIRSPLSAVQGTLAVTSQGKFGQLDEKGLQRLMSAEHNIEKVNRLISDLLTIDTIESGNLSVNYEPAGLKSLVDEAVSTIKPLAEERAVSIINKCGEVELDCDAMRIEQVLINLVSNAIKYSPQAGEIIVDCEHDEDLVTVRVSDSGRGIPPELMEFVFDRFQQVEARDSTEHKGFGLGLAICKGIVESHGGNIDVQSLQGKGTTFWFTIPRYEEIVEA